MNAQVYRQIDDDQTKPARKRAGCGSAGVENDFGLDHLNHLDQAFAGGVKFTEARGQHLRVARVFEVDQLIAEAMYFKVDRFDYRVALHAGIAAAGACASARARVR